jgi:hypothetical protein
MSYLQGEVVFQNNGMHRYVYACQTDCPPIASWVRRNGAKAMVEWVSAGGSPVLQRPEWEGRAPSMVPDPTPYKSGDSVRAVPASDATARHEADLISVLVRASTQLEYEDRRRALARVGYTDEDLDAVAPPE